MISARARLLAEALLCAAIVLLFHHPLLNPYRLQSGGDAANLFWPMKVLLQDTLFAQGIVPLWNHYSFLGHPVLATLQHAVFYIPDYPLLALLPAHVAFQWSVAFHLAFCGAGAWAFLRVGLCLAPVVAVLFGSTFPCLAWFAGHTEHINQIAAVAWFPWGLLMVHLFLRRRIDRLKFISLYATIVALQLHAGHPQEALYAIFFQFLYLCFGLRDRCFIEIRDYLACYLSAGILAGMLCAVVYLPAMELSGLVSRLVTPLEYSQAFSLPPQALSMFLLPDAFGNPLDGPREFLGVGLAARTEYGVYIGIPMLLLAMAGGIFALIKREKRFFAISAILFLLLAMGGNTAPTRLLSFEFAENPANRLSLYGMLTLLPPFESFRVPARFLFLVGFSLLCLGAIIANHLICLYRVKAYAALVLLSLINFYQLYQVASKESYHRAAPVASAMAIAAEDRQQYVAGAIFRLTISDDAFLFDPALRNPDAEPLLARTLRLHPHVNYLSMMRTLDGYEEGLLPTDAQRDFLYSYNRNFRQFTPDTQLLGLLGVQYIYSDLPVDSSVYTLNANLSLAERPLYTNPAFRGSAFALDRLEGLASSSLLGPQELGADRLRGPAGEVRPLAPLPRWNDESLPMLVTDFSKPNQLMIRTPRETAAVVVLPRYRGWTLNGEPVSFIGPLHAELPTASFWELRFQPRSYQVGLFISIIGLMILGFVMAVIGKRRARW